MATADAENVMAAQANVSLNFFMRSSVGEDRDVSIIRIAK